MKKIYALLMVTLGFFAQYLSAEPLTAPDPAKTYMIQHSSGYFFTVDGNSAKIMSPGAGTCQKFTFEPVEGLEGTYNIKAETGVYVGSDNAYNVKFFEAATDQFTQFTFWECTEVDHVKMWNEGRRGYFGTDNNSEGGGVYSDKSGLDGKHAWKFVEATDGLIYYSLDNAIAAAEDFVGNDFITQPGIASLNAAIAAAKSARESAADQAAVNEAAATLTEFIGHVRNLVNAIQAAQTTLDNAAIGNAPGNYPQAAADALAAAIATAKEAWGETDAAAYTAAVTPLNAAVSTFNGNQIVFMPEAGKQYMFLNTYNNFMMGIRAGSGEAELQIPTAEANQRYEIVPVEGQSVAFNLKIADGSGFLAKKGGWNSTTVSDPTTDGNAGVIYFGLVDAENKIYTLNRVNYGGAWASDDNTVGATIYTNKSQNQNNARWQIVEYKEGEFLTLGLDKAIENAEYYIANSVVGEEPGMYPQSALDALKAALAAAKAIQPASQDDVNAAAAALNAAINAFLAEKIDPFFVPEANTAYRFSVRKYEANYMTANGTDKVGTANYTAGDANQHWTFVPVEGAKYTYIVKNNGLALSVDGTLAEVADADAQKWTAVYTTTVNNLPYFALVQYDDPNKVITFGSGKNFAVQDLNKGNTAHQARFLRVDMPNDPNVSALEIAVANARYTLENVVRGNEIGQYTQAKCDAFEAVVNATAALRGLTQEELDAKVAELNNARTDFINNPNSVIKDELDAAIAAAKAKAEAAEIGIEVGQYYPSEILAFQAKIAEFEAAAKAVTEQDACDALTQEVKDATDAFAGNAEVQPVADVLADVIKWCEDLYEAEKDNVGDNQGQRPQTAVDAFSAAIAAAKAAKTPEITDLQALLDAREAFLAGAVSQNRTPIRKAIAEAEGDEFANLVAGEFNGNYPQEKIEAFNKALAEAKAAEADSSKSQEELDAATKKLNDAMADLRKSVVTISYKDLDEALAAAEAAVAKVTVVGSEAGQCPQAVVDALKAVITEAKAIDRDAVKQADVDAMAAKLGNATAKFNADVVESTGLSAAIVAANSLLEGAEAGFKPGNYPAAAIANLRAAIEAAELVSLNNASTQAELLAAVKNLADAVEAFKAQVVPANDLTSINAVIAEAEDFIAKTNCDDFVLLMALEDAKAIVADADNYTKSQISKAESDLRKALEFAKEQVGIDAIYAGELSVMAADGAIVVKGLSADATVAVYTIDGRLVALTQSSENVYTLAVAAGKYVVAVKADNNAVSRVVIVK